jgi:hypothetical protein
MKTSRLLLSALIFLLGIQLFAGEHQKPDLRIPSGSRSLILVNPLSDGEIAASDLVSSLLPPGTPFSNVNYAGPSALGSFSGGSGANFGLDKGIVIGNGCISQISTGGFNCDVLNLPGDPDLNGLGFGYYTYDVANLEFDFTPSFNKLYLKIIYATAESSYILEEPGGIFLDGLNVALIPGSSDEISLRTIWGSPFFFNNNDISAYIYSYSSVISISAPVTPGKTHHLKIAIADGLDNIVNSYLFVDIASPLTTVPISWWSVVLSLALIVGFTTYRFITVHRI